MDDNYAPLIDVLVAYYEAVAKLHEEQAKDPKVRVALHKALDLILDGEVRFKRPPKESEG